ncbi:MAG TPA: aldo/keto reductase [Acidimicrobiia bacterium]|nr:aldo/keto reductase [Acidimicrobiia bacterium]
MANKIGSLEVSVAGIGCNNFGMRIDEDRSREVVDAAIDAGVTHFDTADLYGGGKSEEFLGRALGPRRDQVVITTKFGMRPPPDGLAPGSPEWVARAIDESLQRLGTDHVDLYLLHQPDPSTPIGDTLEAMSALVDAGKVREIGGSNFSAAQLDEMASAARERGVRPFVNLQNEYSLVQRDAEAEVIPACMRLGITFVPYFPLASGLLTGKYKRDEPAPEGSRLAAWGDRAGAFLSDERFDLVERLDEYARAHGHTLQELALSWLATNPAVVSVIAGATSPEQVRSNAAATTAWPLTDKERQEVAALLG